MNSLRCKTIFKIKKVIIKLKLEVGYPDLQVAGGGYLTKFTENEINYWEDGMEIDVIINLPEITIPIEVKSRHPKKAKKSVKKFLEENENAYWGLVVSTDDEIRLKDNILFIPLWMFLLMC